ncbi:hypothetical protein MRX96_034459 [Rhipicephalus microplus]
MPSASVDSASIRRSPEHGPRRRLPPRTARPRRSNAHPSNSRGQTIKCARAVANNRAESVRSEDVGARGIAAWRLLRACVTPCWLTGGECNKIDRRKSSEFSAGGLIYAAPAGFVHFHP